MRTTKSQVITRLGLTAALLVLAAPVYAQQSSSPKLPYDFALARVKEKSTDQGIWYGEKTAPGAFPFIVALIQSDTDDTPEGNYNGQFCGGSLISDRWVVTAAHCVTGEDDDKRPITVAPEKLDIYAGSTDFKDGARIKVKRVIRHPGYQNETFDNDIALLELADSATSPKTQTIALATPVTEAAVGGVGKMVTAAGWGETEAKETPTELRHVDMQVLDNGMCNAGIISYRKGVALADLMRKVQLGFRLGENVVQQVRLLIENNAGKVVNDNMICSGKLQTQRDTCQGDSGGPLFGKGADGKYVLIGLTSWGELCGQSDKGLFGIYSRVAHYSSWVQENAK